MRDFTGLDDLVFDLHRQVDRNGERDALKSAGTAVNLRIDADDGTVGVKQRAAGISGIDRRVRLNEGHVAVTGQRTPFGADDAGRRGFFETKGFTDGEHIVADTQLV